MAGYNFGKKYGPYLGGAMGGVVGSTVPGVGTATGAAAGAAAGRALGGSLDDLLNWLNPEQPQQMPPNPNLDFVREQMRNMMNQQAPQNPNLGYLREQLMNPQNNYNPQDYENMQRLANENFQQNTVPAILNRFSGLNVGQNSGINQALRQGATDLDTRLAAMREQMANQRGQMNLQRLGALGELEGNQQLFGLRNQQEAFRRLEGLGGLETGQQNLGLRQQGLNLQREQMENANDPLSMQNLIPLLSLLRGDVATGEQARQNNMGRAADINLGIQSNARPPQAPHLEQIPGQPGFYR